MIRSLAVVVVCLLVAGCSSGPAATAAPASSVPPAASGTPAPSPSAVTTSPSPTASLPILTADQRLWCTNHTGGPADDQHQVEDMAISMGVIPGAKTRDDIFGRWAGHPASDPDPTYLMACVAAYAAFASPSPG